MVLFALKSFQQLNEQTISSVVMHNDGSRLFPSSPHLLLKRPPDSRVLMGTYPVSEMMCANYDDSGDWCAQSSSSVVPVVLLCVFVCIYTKWTQSHHFYIWDFFLSHKHTYLSSFYQRISYSNYTVTLRYIISINMLCCSLLNWQSGHRNFCSFNLGLSKTTRYKWPSCL